MASLQGVNPAFRIGIRRPHILGLRKCLAGGFRQFGLLGFSQPADDSPNGNPKEGGYLRGGLSLGLVGRKVFLLVDPADRKLPAQ